MSEFYGLNIRCRNFSKNIWNYFIWVLGFFMLFACYRSPEIVGWDECFYMSQLQSAISNRNLLLHDQILSYPNTVRIKFEALTSIHESGALLNTFSIGPAITHGFLIWPYCYYSPSNIWTKIRPAIALESFFYLILFLMTLYSIIRKAGFSSDIARLCCFFSISATPLMLYATRFYTNSQFLSAFWTSLLTLMLLEYFDEPSFWSAIGIGISSGMVVLCRWQDLLVLLIFIPALINLSCKSRSISRKHFRIHSMLAVTIFLLLAMIQLRVWNIQFGSYFLIPQGKSYLAPSVKNMIAFFISGYHGVIPWHPGLFLGLMLLLFIKVNPESIMMKRIQTGYRILLPFIFLISASPQDWWGGASFGPRRLCSIVVFACMGFAHLLSRIHKIWRSVILIFLLLYSVVTSTLFIAGIDDLTLPITGGKDFFRPESVSVDGSLFNYLRLKWAVKEFCRPGFSLVSEPHTPEKTIGALTLATIMAAAFTAWRLTKYCRGFRILFLSAWTCWIFVWIISLTIVFPLNTESNRLWLMMLADEQADLAIDQMPQDLVDAAYFTRAIRSRHLHEDDDFLKYVLKLDLEKYNLNLDEIMNFCYDYPESSYEKIFKDARYYYAIRNKDAK